MEDSLRKGLEADGKGREEAGRQGIRTPGRDTSEWLQQLTGPQMGAYSEKNRKFARQTHKPTHIMKRIYNYIVAAVAAIGLCACSGDDAPTFKPVLPTRGGAPVKAVSNRGSVDQSYDWRFTYKNERLTQANGTVRAAADSYDKAITMTANLNYGTNQVKVTTSNGSDTQLSLNSSGYIVEMRVNRNVYTFSYGFEGRITKWKKTVYEETIGVGPSYVTTGDIDYSGGNISTITYTETGNAPIVLHFTPAVEPNANGVLPVAVTKELGLMGYEYLFYAGLFGAATQNLVKSVAYEFPNEQLNYTLNFSYSFRNDGNLDLCSYYSQNGQPASVNYDY